MDRGHSEDQEGDVRRGSEFMLGRLSGGGCRLDSTGSG
jgi:hypothetical protein